MPTGMPAIPRQVGFVLIHTLAELMEAKHQLFASGVSGLVLEIEECFELTDSVLDAPYTGDQLVQVLSLSVVFGVRCFHTFVGKTERRSQERESEGRATGAE